jgi:hypothetical protein
MPWRNTKGSSTRASGRFACFPLCSHMSEMIAVVRRVRKEDKNSTFHLSNCRARMFYM